MTTTIIIPEAGGDLGFGARKMALDLNPPLEIILLEADVSTVRGLGHHFAEIPKVTSDKEGAIEAFLNLLKGPALRGGVILPTGEFFPEILFDKRVEENLASAGVQTFLPTRMGWEVSRDKLLLGEHSWGVPTKKTWSKKHPYGKPRRGVGARGCALFRTVGEAEAMGEEFVFMEYLPGNDWVVDLINIRGERRALTREVYRQRGGADTNFVYRARPDLERIAFQVAEDLEAPVVNVQFRENSEGKPYVIDIGTRLSGASCGARLIGVNWVGGLLGVPGWWGPRVDWEGIRIVRNWVETLV